MRKERTKENRGGVVTMKEMTLEEKNNVRRRD